ncbi:hypothetical protein Q3V23_33995 [Streptomyces sp. VNUA116]|uniref:terpene synthase family protein n=1 Tax=Streptomyces sp. VNUA116 TaxID=3062449 RepID=UPI00267743FD|nr:hypothetical protein [Streptomyces sp. VNUA116]WKU48685.1 hypothetical protein Q3V23_33995 [Streptomyces sp. VNUA116]
MLEFANRHSLADSKTLKCYKQSELRGAYFLTFYPDASKENRQLGAEIYLWFLAFDEIYAERIGSGAVDDLTQRIFELLDVLGGYTAEPTPGFGAALADILRRAETWTMSQQNDLRNALYGIMVGWQWEVQFRNAHSQPSVQTYMGARRHLVAALLERAILEPLNGYVLPDTARRDPQVIRLNRALANIQMWVNDLCSYEKERRQDGNFSVTLPNALMHEEKCSLSDAFTRISELTNLEAEVAAELIEYLGESPLPEVRAYTRATERLLRGTTTFYATSGFGRYTDG